MATLDFFQLWTLLRWAESSPDAWIVGYIRTKIEKKDSFRANLEDKLHFGSDVSNYPSVARLPMEFEDEGDEAASIETILTESRVLAQVQSIRQHSLAPQKFLRMSQV